MAGFGHSKFGSGPFGISDAGSDLIIDTFPVEYLEDAVPQGVDPMDDSQNLLLQMLKTYARAMQEMRLNVDNMQQLVDYSTAPSDILLLLGSNFGLSLDDNDPDFLKRSFVANASQWLQIKSTVEGYSVRGLASGFLVSVKNFWRIDPSYAPLIPLRNLFYLKPAGADAGAVPLLHTDAPPGQYPATPTTEDPTYAKSAWLQVIFEIKDYALLPNNFNTLLDLAIDKISDVQGIHHELTTPEFRIKLHADLNITADMTIEEQIVDYRFNEFNHFDLIPADVQPCDATSEVEIIIA